MLLPLHAKVLNLPRQPDDFDALIHQWNSKTVVSAYVINEQITDTHLLQFENYNGDLWIIFRVLLNSNISGYPLAILHDGSEAIGDGDGDWLEMLCPYGVSNNKTVVEYRIEQILERLSEYPRTAGVSLDFVRHFAFWEGVSPDSNPQDIPRSCFCDRCVAKFVEHYSLSIPSFSSVQERSSWILEHHLELWEQFTESTISDLIREIVSTVKRIHPEKKWNMHSVPWKDGEFLDAQKTHLGQNLERVSDLLNQVSPMCYSSLLYRPFSWIGEVVNCQSQQAGKAIIPAVQISPMYGTAPLFQHEFDEMIDVVQRSSASGVMIWPWEQLTNEQLQSLPQL